MSKEQIIEYNPVYRKQYEDFIHQASLEGSAQTFRRDKINPENLDPKSSLWIALVDDVIVSTSYAQRSFITGTPESIRKCRYHILKKHRHGRYGFKFFEKQLQWAKENDYKHYYWTHDVNDKAINELFQHKRTYMRGRQDDKYFKDNNFQKLKLETDFVFHDSPKSNMIQFVYSYYIDENYTWQPTEAIIRHKHNGFIDNSKDIIETKYF